MSEKLPEFIKNYPKIHANGTACWSIEEEVISFLLEAVKPGFLTLETGAGISTIMFAYKGCDHTCISPQDDEHERIRNYCENTGISADKVKFICDFSQNALPKIESDQLDLVLIDGGHGFPVPFVDWLYTSVKLKKGGLVIVDDTQLWTGRVLKEFLEAERQWKRVRTFGKAVAFEKLSDDVIKDFGGQPYVVANSEMAEDWPYQMNIIRGHVTALKSAFGKLLEVEKDIHNKKAELSNIAHELDQMRGSVDDMIRIISN
jgi:predicted O-methyltransferase YrrM